MNIEEVLSDNSIYTETILEKALSKEKIGDTKLSDAMRYAVLGGGKRIRAFLVRCFCDAFGGTNEDAEPAMCSIEFVHGYSLVHDDMPCMDNDDYRRGRPSCHKAFGEANALIAGDALLTYAFENLANSGMCGCKLRNSIKALSYGAGAKGMCYGQHLDLVGKFENYKELANMQNGKTGALIKAACLLGYYAATKEVDENVEKDISIYAENIGMAFQIIDDILDVTSTSDVLGKPVGSDNKNDKITILSFMSIDEASVEAKRLTNEAINAIKKYDKNKILSELALMLLNRKK